MKTLLLVCGVVGALAACSDSPSRSLVFAVEPNVLTPDMTVKLTVYFTPPDPMAKPPSAVSVEVHGSSKKIALTNVTPVMGHTGQVQATVTGGQLSAGSYDVVLGDGGTLANGLVVVAQPDITITKVDPPFGDPATTTAITITTSGYALADTPHVYVSQAGAATELRAVSLQSPTSLTAIVPGGSLAVGDYDVIVTDPLDASGGHVAELAKGFHLIAGPPVIASVTPPSILSANTTTLYVTGSGFAAGATAYFSECSAPTGVTPPTTPFSLGAASSVTSTSLQVQITGGTLTAGVACVLRIVNGSPADAATPCPNGGTCLPYADYSAVAATNNSGDLGDFTASSAGGSVVPLQTARRALGSVVGHTSPSTRFIYALGGDTGTTAGALDDIEFTELDPVGNMLGWQKQVNSMTSKRTELSTVRIGQFIYAIGGSDGANALSTVETARILDPLDVPDAPDLDLTPSTTGVAAGNWVYKITGVRDAAYASDPGGETLASDPLSITVPDLTKNTKAPLAKVTLTWPMMANVVSYNIYRTSAAGQPASQVQLIGNVAQPTMGTTVSFDDTGIATMGQAPLPLGSLGKWHATSSLSVARVGGAAVAAFGGSDAMTETWYLYVAGGASDAAFASLEDSYEWAKVTINKMDGSQTVSTFSSVSGIGGGRVFLSAYTADHTLMDAIPPGKTWVYFGTGTANASGATSIKQMRAGSITAGATSGELTALQTVNAANTGGGGAAPISGLTNTSKTTGYLFTFGGWTSITSLSNTEASSICPASGCPNPTQPFLNQWANGGGGRPTIPRVMLGTVVEAPFIYIIGGATDAAAATPTTSTERAVW